VAVRSGGSRPAWRFEEDGSLAGTFRLPPLAGAVLLKALRAAAGDLAHPQQEHDGVSAETREPRMATSSTLADALVAVAEAFLAEKVAEAQDAEMYQVVVHVGTEAIGAAGPADASAETPPAGPAPGDPADPKRCHVEDGPAISVSTAQMIGCTALPTSPALPQPGGSIEETHDADISPDTIIPPWYGERLDLDHALYVCLANARTEQQEQASRDQAREPRSSRATGSANSATGSATPAGTTTNTQPLASARTEFLRRRPVSGQCIEPPHVIRTIELPLLGHDPVKVLADQFHDHVHHIVPVVAEPGQPLNCLPRLGRVVGQQLVRDHSVQRDVQRRVHRLAAGGSDLFMPFERPCHLEVLCLEQESALVLVVRMQQLQVEPPIGAMPSGYCPRSPVARERLIEPAVGRLLGLPRGHTPERPAA
jgi:hypothetical protein